MERALRNPVLFDMSWAGVAAQVTRRAAAEPDRTAVLADDRQVSYQGLCHRAWQFRTILLDAGCGEGDRVAVAGDRGVDIIAAFLAVESIGAVYLPLDHAWPAARIAGVLRRSEPFCAIGLRATGACASTLASACAEAGVSLLAAPGSEVPPSVPAVPRSPEPDEPRYVIYTSGSTGQPKGAVATHQGMVNHLLSMVRTLGLSESDTIGFSASPGYVISIWQMLAALLVGGTVAVVSEADTQFGRRLAGCLARTQTTVAELVPTVIGWLAGEARKHSAALPDLRCLISTGEKLDTGLAARVAEVFPGVELYNAYGSTECSDDVSLYRCQGTDLDRPQIPVGTPVPNAVLYLLVNEAGAWRPADAGETGELFVGGAGVGLGYLDDPELTREAFFADPFDPDSPTGRLYRTRDLARFENGLAHCLGRADRQVKIAGVRIELDEIEAVLTQVPGVEWCAVVAEQHNGQRQLAVHYVAEATVGQEVLYAVVRERLPAAMFPRRWARLDSLPRNSSGKVDYRALAGPVHA
ncbi:amino acid adenylation domain-containing protein [Longispora albida]|uniref:amino acid adenylation domain-containing protein n=1 Tax=Longispora albida TaxID=203523 RepID=UPI000686CAC1|nr:amino acid adenylation domain-containing protein [Longispora albida]